MEVVNCPRCGKIFTKIKNPLCPLCEQEEEKVFQLLKKFIEDNPFCTLNELSESTNVSPKRILRFIRDGRLEISKGMHGEIRCEVCNKPITHGRYCDACLIRLNQHVGELFTDSEKRKSDGIRMHIAGNKKL